MFDDKRAVHARRALRTPQTAGNSSRKVAMLKMSRAASTSALLTCASAKAPRTAPATHQVAATTARATANATVESAVGSLGSEGARHRWSRAPSSMTVPLTG